MIRVITLAALAALAVVTANSKEHRPTQPIHRSILSQRKRTILRGSSDSNKKGGSSLHSSKERRAIEPNSAPDNEQLSHDASLLTSDRWIKIHEEVGQNSFNFVPESRRAASSVVFTYRYNNEANNNSTKAEGEEYMIISGGYTDSDWKTFPIYAFSITAGIKTQRGQWIDLSPSILEDNIESQWCHDEDGATAREKLYQEAEFLGKNSTGDPWEQAQHCAPSGRMGHQSVVFGGQLYVFGGLIYDEEQALGGYGRRASFRLEDVPFVYRLDLNEMFKARQAESKGKTSIQKVKGWQRIIPRVKPFSSPAGISSTSAAEVLLSSVNRGEMGGGLWGHDKFVMYGGLRIARLEYNGPSKFVKGGTTKMYPHKIVELPLGDVWAYDLVRNAWEKITNDYGRPLNDDTTTADNEDPVKDDDWSLHSDISLYPRPRTAHAATVVGTSLVIQGGMGWDEKTNDWDGSTDWETLDDMWILDLSTRTWTRRYIFPSLERSYHSLVAWTAEPGWGKDFNNYTSWDGPVVSVFGGYTTGIDIFSGEELAYVFDDLLVSFPPPPKTKYDEPPSPWLKAIMGEEDSADLISTRYEHSSILSKEGVLVVWGGSFQDTKNVKGVWMINIAGKESSINLQMAENDDIYNDFEKTITALHTIVLMLMFLSFSLVLLLGLTQRYNELIQQANDTAAIADGAAFAGQDFGDETPTWRGSGLHPEIIDTIPRKIYSASDASGGADEGDPGDVCPICLVDYAEGDELRVLPCNHFMHQSCLDAWLANHPSCPSCRHSLSELVDDQPMMQLRTLRSRLSTNPTLARFLRHDSYREGGIEMIDQFSDGAIFHITSLALSEEEEGRERERHGINAEDTATHISTMEELSNWRRQRRQLQQNHSRPSALASLRHLRFVPLGGM